VSQSSLSSQVNPHTAVDKQQALHGAHLGVQRAKTHTQASSDTRSRSYISLRRSVSENFVSSEISGRTTGSDDNCVGGNSHACLCVVRRCHVRLAEMSELRRVRVSE
jgi:hypothetical protein